MREASRHDVIRERFWIELGGIIKRWGGGGDDAENENRTGGRQYEHYYYGYNRWITWEGNSPPNTMNPNIGRGQDRIKFNSSAGFLVHQPNSCFVSL